MDPVLFSAILCAAITTAILTKKRARPSDTFVGCFERESEYPSSTASPYYNAFSPDASVTDFEREPAEERVAVSQPRRIRRHFIHSKIYELDELLEHPNKANGPAYMDTLMCMLKAADPTLEFAARTRTPTYPESVDLVHDFVPMGLRQDVPPAAIQFTRQDHINLYDNKINPQLVSFDEDFYTGVKLVRCEDGSVGAEIDGTESFERGSIMGTLGPGYVQALELIPEDSPVRAIVSEVWLAVAQLVLGVDAPAARYGFVPHVEAGDGGTEAQPRFLGRHVKPQAGKLERDCIAVKMVPYFDPRVQGKWTVLVVAERSIDKSETGKLLVKM